MPEEQASTAPPQSEVSGKEPQSYPIDFGQADYRRFYANHVQSSMSLFELRLILSNIQGFDQERGKLVADEALHVIMSPELAWGLLGVLRNALHDYVKAYGPIRGAGNISPAVRGSAHAVLTPAYSHQTSFQTPESDTASAQTPATAEPPQNPDERMELG